MSVNIEHLECDVRSVEANGRGELEQEWPEKKKRSREAVSKQRGEYIPRKKLLICLGTSRVGLTSSRKDQRKRIEDAT